MSDLLIVKLFEAYWNAWVFFLLHMMVLLFVAVSFHRLYKEIRAVRAWQPTSVKPQDESGTDITQLLDSFTLQASALGERGIFLPLTDYSDRIDAIITGLISSLHDRIQMFLLVGIAGTLTGLFEFANSTKSALTAETVGNLLAEAMATAFPVGIVGLGAMFVFQYIAVYPEDKLHNEVAGATRRALDNRGEVTGSAQNHVETLASTVKEVLAPLANLQTTINDSLVSALRKVLSELNDTLTKQITVMNTHVATLEGATSDFKHATTALVQATTDLTEPVKRMTRAVKEMPELLQKTGEIQTRLLKRGTEIQEQLLERGNEVQQSLQEQSRAIQDRYQSVLDKTVTIYDGAAKTFEQTVATAAGVKDALFELHAKLADLPPAIVEGAVDGARQSFKEVGLQSAEFWQESFDTLRQEVHGELVSYVSRLRETVEEIHKTLMGAASEMQRLATNSNEVMVEPVQKVIDHGKEQILVVLDKVADMVREAAPAANRLAELARIAGETAAVLEKHQQKKIVTEPTLVHSRNADLDRLASEVHGLVIEIRKANDQKHDGQKRGSDRVITMIRDIGSRVVNLFRR